MNEENWYNLIRFKQLTFCPERLSRHSEELTKHLVSVMKRVTKP